MPPKRKSKKNNIHLGHVTFNTQFTKKIQKQLINKQVKQIINSNKWTFHLVEALSQQWNNIFPYIQQADCQQILITFHFKPGILNYVIYPTYNNLTSLEISGNMLLTIESLSYLKAQNLKQIKLQADFITSFKTLNKTNWTNLEQFVYMKNYVYQYEIGRIKYKKQFKHICCQDIQHGQVANQDISFIAKLQCNKMIDNILIFNKKRIKQQECFKGLNRKYHDQKPKVIMYDPVMQALIELRNLLQNIGNQNNEQILVDNENIQQNQWIDNLNDQQNNQNNQSNNINYPHMEDNQEIELNDQYNLSNEQEND